MSSSFYWVAEIVAEQYISEEWPIDRIKTAHDRHIHKTGADEDNMYYECIGCPSCPDHRCPVPIENHETLI